MTSKQRTRGNNCLSKHLRRDPGGLGRVFEAGGRVPVDALLDGCRRAGIDLSRDELAGIVVRSDQERFAFDGTATRIRANQRHSVEVDLQLAPPAVLYHGTGAATLPMVLPEGLREMGRHRVHLSPGVRPGTRIGARHGRPVVLAVDTAAMARAGHEFYVSANGVWLTDHVPRAFLRQTEGPTA